VRIKNYSKYYNCYTCYYWNIWLGKKRKKYWIIKTIIISTFNWMNDFLGNLVFDQTISLVLFFFLFFGYSSLVVLSHLIIEFISWDIYCFRDLLIYSSSFWRIKKKWISKETKLSKNKKLAIFFFFSKIQSSKKEQNAFLFILNFHDMIKSG